MQMQVKKGNSISSGHQQQATSPAITAAAQNDALVAEAADIVLTHTTGAEPADGGGVITSPLHSTHQTAPQILCQFCSLQCKKKINKVEQAQQEEDQDGQGLQRLSCDERQPGVFVQSPFLEFFQNRLHKDASNLVLSHS